MNGQMAIMRYSSKQRLIWAAAALIVGVLIAGFWNYHLVDGLGKNLVANPIIGEEPAATYAGGGAGFGFLFAAVAGLAATFTACNCVVFSMLPGLACSTGDSAARVSPLRALLVFTLAVVVVCACYGVYINLLGGDFASYNEREVRLSQAQTVFTAIGAFMILWGLFTFGFLRFLSDALPVSVQRFFASKQTQAGLMGVMAGFFAVGRPYPVFRSFLAYAASSGNVWFDIGAMVVQGLAQIAVMVILFMLVLWLAGGSLARWVAAKPQQVQLVSSFALLGGGAFFVYYWGLAFTFDIGQWGFKLNWYDQ